MFNQLHRGQTSLHCPGATNSIGQMERPVQNRDIYELNT
jgi:hypothetical protein